MVTKESNGNKQIKISKIYPKKSSPKITKDKKELKMNKNNYVQNK